VQRRETHQADDSTPSGVERATTGESRGLNEMATGATGGLNSTVGGIADAAAGNTESGAGEGLVCFSPTVCSLHHFWIPCR
jgi:hypothetical protein